MKLTHYLGDRPFWNTTLRLAVPVVIQNLLTSSFALVDTLMVSSLGDLTLSATGMAGQWNFVYNMLIFGITATLSLFASQFFGVGDMKGIRRTYGLSLLAGMVFAAGFVVPAAVFPEAVIGLFNKDPDVIRVGASYLRFAAWSYPAYMLSFIFASLLRSVENVRLPMYASAISTLLNVFFNYSLIFGKFGMPRMGVEGAALATCISAWSGPVILLGISLIKKDILTSRLKDVFTFTGKQAAAYIKKCVPLTFNSGIWGFGTMIVTAIFSNIGYEEYAAVTMLRTFGDLIFACYVGFGNAAIIQVGQDVGAGRIAMAKRNALRYTVLVVLASVILGGAIAIFRRGLIALYDTAGTVSPVTYATAMGIMLFYGLEQPWRNVAYIEVDGIYRSGGDAVTGAILDGVCLWLIAIPVALLCVHVWHLPFVWVFAITYMAEDIPKTILCFIHLASDKWLRPVTPEGKAGLEAYKRRRSHES